MLHELCVANRKKTQLQLLQVNLEATSYPVSVANC
jgi:hypothetical protein